MSWSRMIFKEIWLRRRSFLLSTAIVAVAVAAGLVQLWRLQVHDQETAAQLAAQKARVEEESRKLEDDYRKITKGLGFNLVILPARQSVSEYLADGVVREHIPEEYVARLASSNIVTIQHLAPLIEAKITWPERQDEPIILVGTSGEVSVEGDMRAPILKAVPPGQAVLGYQLWSPAGLKVGDEVVIRQKTLQISECLPERGTKEDITAWIPLPDAQELLGMQGQVSAMMALKCHCDGNDLASIRAAVAAALPGVHVLEIADKAKVRADARDRAHAAAVAALEQQTEQQAERRQQIERLTAWLVPLCWLTAAIVVGSLALFNALERSSEIGILRAYGAQSISIVWLILARTIVVGLLGAVLGIAIVLAAGAIRFGATDAVVLMRNAVGRWDTALLVLGGPLLAILMACPPAVIAARRDPAPILARSN